MWGVGHYLRQIACGKFFASVCCGSVNFFRKMEIVLDKLDML